MIVSIVRLLLSNVRHKCGPGRCSSGEDDCTHKRLHQQRGSKRKNITSTIEGCDFQTCLPMEVSLISIVRILALTMEECAIKITLINDTVSVQPGNTSTVQKK